MMKRRKKGFLALVLCFAFVFGYIPGMKNMVWADGEKPVIVEYKGYENVPYSFEYDSLDDAFAAMVKLCEIDSNDYDNKDKKPTSEFNVIINENVESTKSYEIKNPIIFHLNKYKVTVNGELSSIIYIDIDKNSAGILEINGSICGAVLHSVSDNIININAGETGYIEAFGGTVNINGGTVNGLFLENKNETNVNVTISGDAKINLPNIEADVISAISVIYNNAEDCGSVNLTLEGGYYATDPNSLLKDEKTKDHVTLGEHCVIESYEECTKTEQEEWVKVADPAKYPYRVVDPTKDAIVKVWYNTADGTEGEEKYYKSIADMAKDLDEIADSLEKSKTTLTNGFNIMLLSDVTIGKDETYSVKNNNKVNIDLNEHNLIVNGKLVFGCDEIEMVSPVPGTLVVGGVVNKNISIESKDTVSILAGEYDSIENVAGTLKLTDVKVSNLSSLGGETNVTDCTIKNLMITNDGVVSVFGDTKVEVVEFGKEDEAEAEFAYTLNLRGGYFGNTLGAYAEADEKSFEKHVALDDDLEILDYQD